MAEASSCDLIVELAVKSQCKNQCFAQFIHLRQWERYNQGAYFTLGHSLDVIQIDRTLSRHSISLGQKHL